MRLAILALAVGLLFLAYGATEPLRHALDSLEPFLR